MPPLHDLLIRNYAMWMLFRNIFSAEDVTYESYLTTLLVDLQVISGIRNARYLRERSPVMKIGNIKLAWEHAQEDKDHHRFLQILRVSPDVFEILFQLIRDDPVFQNNSNNPQEDVDVQLGVTLYRLGRYGNGASVMDVARFFGISEGSVENYTERCFTAIIRLHNIFVRPLTDEEKETEKKWIDDQVGFQGSWREGYLMYDGTIVVIFARPGKDGDTYYTRKSTYGFNLQVSNY